MTHSRSAFATALAYIIGVIVVLIMIRLGFWQLNRAAQKQVIFDQRTIVSQQAAVEIATIANTQGDKEGAVDKRYLPVVVTGTALPDTVVLHDNQVIRHRVGYNVYSIYEVKNGLRVLVKLGWTPKTNNADNLEGMIIPSQLNNAYGRLNKLPEQPPLWDDSYSVVDGDIWQFMPLNVLRERFGDDLLPLVVELRPDNDTGFEIQLRDIENSDVAMHKGYSLQWFAMAATLAIIILVLTVRRVVRPSKAPHNLQN